MIDLRDGRAVRGRAGDRARYLPVRSRLVTRQAEDLSDPLRLLFAYRERLRPEIVYVADLDRIAGRGENDATLLGLVAAAPGIRFLWDGGFADAASIALASRNGRVAPVAGTETLRSLEELRPVNPPGAGSRPVLSLDLGRDGVLSRSPLIAPLREEEILLRARRYGVRSAILLLLDRVGTGAGLPRERLSRLRAAAGHLDLLAGGGIGSIADLAFLRAGGFSGALLATVLHDGAITADELRSEGYVA